MTFEKGKRGGIFLLLVLGCTLLAAWGCGKASTPPIPASDVTWERTADFDKNGPVGSLEIPKGAQVSRRDDGQNIIYIFQANVAMKKLALMVVTSPLDEYTLKSMGPEKILEERKKLDSNTKLIKDEKLKDLDGNPGWHLASIKGPVFAKLWMYVVGKHIVTFSSGGQADDIELFREFERRFVGSVRYKKS